MARSKKKEVTAKENVNEKKYFIGIQNHPIIRHRALTSLRDIIYILKSYEEFKDIRREKLEKVKQLQDILVSLSETLKGLRASLPEVEDKYKLAPSESKKNVVKKEANMPRKYNRIYELEQQLRDLERKIKTVDVDDSEE
ncbi:MAG: hypothetical protein GWP09_00590 [Nitrospiraceae bacterium]|nr:hypothetical protein [Nitrospiraceae bacterium]